MARKKTARTRNARPPLSSLELEVMSIVWELERCTSAQVTQEFAKRRPLAPTTIRTVLTNLRDKGYIERVPSIERGFVFRPKVQRETVARRLLTSLLSPLFQNSPQQAIACLLDHEDITDADLDELRQMIDARRKRNRP